MTLAPYVQILGRGPGRARSLTMDEAQAAMTVVLSGQAAPEAVGAMLMLLRMKGETAGEIAGFVRAARASLPDWTGPRPALDWPSYAAGRTRGLPWFLLSARLVAQAGFPVLLHGWNSDQSAGAAVRDALVGQGIASCAAQPQAAAALSRDGIAYLPLESLSPDLFRLLRLRSAFGLRSCINTCLRVLNPGGAEAAVQGVFHPPYRDVQMDAGALLGQPNLTIIKGGGGEFERNPAKDAALFGLRDGQKFEQTAPALLNEVRRLAEGPTDPVALTALWDGDLIDPFAQAIVLGTVALALETLGADGSLADDLWHNRHAAKAA